MLRYSGTTRRGLVCSWPRRSPSVSGPTQLDLITRPTSFISGTVSGPSGLVEDGYVQFFETCTDYQQDNPVAEQSYEDGAYEACLPDGTFLARIVPYQNDVARSWHNAKNSCEQATAITISGSATRNLVAAGGSLVSGTVSSTAGLVKGGDLAFYPTCDDERFKREAGTARIRSNGYSLHIVPGTYRVEIDPHSGFGAKFSWHSAKASCAGATVVTVTGDGTLNIVASAKLKPTPDPVAATPGPDTGSGRGRPGQPVGEEAAAKLKKGKKAKLAPKTAQGAKLKWTTSTKKVCVVKKTTVTAKKKGACGLSTKAPAVSGFKAFRQAVHDSGEVGAEPRRLGIASQRILDRWSIKSDGGPRRFAAIAAAALRDLPSARHGVGLDGGWMAQAIALRSREPC